MDSYNEVRRVRSEMSKRAGHDIRKLISPINGRWPDDASVAIDPGTKAEQNVAPARRAGRTLKSTSLAATR